ncbi:CBS domain-containing protein [Vibrio mangrovi]|uniref:Uncharacterized protein n=1 Tax=Vibrio mangrovi TaxID=474394 RepID=A0A1Y6ISQ5_9VIBR|nr:hypothetical protein [Vibrio mangrovi]MDW6001305.1 hypothetical protein [Vibrio mangrovi]SMS00675.1 hypothetical protein VIM7927_01944 [Vibrio mangrovi]
MKSRSISKVVLTALLFGSMVVTTSFVTILMATPVAEAKKLTPEEKQLKVDQRQTALALKKINSMQRYIEEDNIKSAERTIKQASKYYGKVSDEFKENDKDAILVGQKIEEYAAAIQQLKDNREAQHQLNETLTQEQRAYSKMVTQWEGVIELLMVGRDKDTNTNYYLGKFPKFEESYAQFVSIEAQVREKLPNLIQLHPKASVNIPPKKISVGEFLDLVHNAAKYRKEGYQVVCDKLFDEQLAYYEKEYNTLKSDDYLNVRWLSRLYGKNADNDIRDIAEIKQAYQSAGIEASKERQDRLASIKPKMRALLKEKAEHHHWSEHEDQYSYSDGDMKRILSKSGRDVEEMGALPAREWKIAKNGLGIPVNRHSNGYVLYEVEDAPFLAGFSVIFYRPFNGQDYDPVSNVSLRDVFVPYED